MITLLNLFSPGIGAPQSAAPQSADAPLDPSLEKACESGEGEFAGLLASMGFASMGITPAALPVERELTGGSDIGLEEPTGEEPVQTCEALFGVAGPMPYDVLPFNELSDVTEDAPTKLFWGGINSKLVAEASQQVLEIIKDKSIDRPLDTIAEPVALPHLFNESSGQITLPRLFKENSEQVAALLAGPRLTSEIAEPVAAQRVFTGYAEPVALPQQFDESANESQLPRQFIKGFEPVAQPRIVKENAEQLAQPSLSNYQPHPASEVVTRALNAARIISQSQSSDESSSAATLSVQDMLDKNGVPHFRSGISEGGASLDEKPAKGASLESFFRDVVRMASSEEAPGERLSKGIRLAPLDASPADEAPLKDNRTPDSFDHRGGEGFSAFSGEAAKIAQAQGSTSNSTFASIAHQVISPMIDAARQMSARETRKLRLEIRPEEFGHLDLEITRGADGRVSASLTADSSAARQALSDGINHLRESLQQSGLNVDRLEVRLGLGADGRGGNNAQAYESEQVYSGYTGPFLSETSETGEVNRTSDADSRLLSLRI